jgi:hypothetical protein
VACKSKKNYPEAMNTRTTTNILLALIAGLLIALVASPVSNGSTKKPKEKIALYLAPSGACPSGNYWDSVELLSSVSIFSYGGNSSLQRETDSFDICRVRVLTN